MRLVWAHHDPPPAALTPTPRPFRGEAVAVDEAVVWGPFARWDALAAAAPGARLLSTDPGQVARARAQGLHGVLVVDLGPDTLARATRPRVWCVPRGTLWPDEGTLWVAGGVERLSPEQRKLVRDLARGLVPTSPRLRVAVARLRHRLGGAIVTERGRGWRLVSLGVEPPAAAPEVAWRPLAVGRYAPGLHLAEVGWGGVAFSEEEVAVLERLWRAAGRPVSRVDLASAAGRSVPVVIHRLRGKLGPQAIASVRRAGYRLVVGEAAPEAPLLARLSQAAAEHDLVFVSGLVGSGKTHWLRRFAESRGTHVLDLHGLPAESQSARLGSLEAQPRRLLVVDGVRHAGDVERALTRLRSLGFRLVVGARVAPGAAVQVALPPPDPAHLGREGEARLLARLAQVPEVDLAASFPAGFTEAEVPRAVLRAWQRAGILVGPGLPRLPKPLGDAVRSRWDAARLLGWARGALARFLRLVDACPMHAEAVRAATDDVLSAIPLVQAAGESAASAIAMLGHVAAGAIDRAWLERELGRDDLSGDLQARLLFARFRSEPGTDHGLLREAIARSGGEVRADLQVQLAYYAHDRDEADRMLAAANAWLATRPPSEATWVRSEAMLLEHQRSPGRVPLEPLVEQAALLERLRLEGHAGGLVFEGMRRRTFHCLGQRFLDEDRPADAVAALSISAGGPRPLVWGGVELVVAWGRLGRWDEARREITRLEPDATSRPSWGARLLAARGLNALWQGDRSTARSAAEPVPAEPTSRKVRDLLLSLVEVAEGRAEVATLPDAPWTARWMSPGQRAGFLDDLAAGAWADGGADDPLASRGV